MAERGLENHELAAKAGTSRQAIYKLRRGLTRMLPHWAKRLAGHLDVSWQELVEGAPTTEDQDRADLLAAFDTMDEEQKRALLGMVKVIARRDALPAPAPKGSPRALRGDGDGAGRSDGVGRRGFRAADRQVRR